MMVSVANTIGWHPTKPHTESTWGGYRYAASDRLPAIVLH